MSNISDKNTIKELAISLVIIDIPLKTFLQTLNDKDKKETEVLINKNKDLWDEKMKVYTNFKELATYLDQTNTSSKEFLKSAPPQITEIVKKNKMAFTKILKGIKQKKEQMPNLKQIINKQKKNQQSLQNAKYLNKNIEKDTVKYYKDNSDMFFEDHYQSLPKRLKDMVKEKKKTLTIQQFEKLSERQKTIFAEYEKLNKLLQNIIGKQGKNRDLGQYEGIKEKIIKQIQQQNAKKTK